MGIEQTIRQKLHRPLKIVADIPNKTDRTIALIAGLCLILYFAARALLEMSTLTPWTRVAIALTPLPAFGWYLWAVLQWANRADELERRIQLEALAVAFVLTLVLVMTLGLLQIAVELSMDDWSYRHIWPLLYVFYLIGIMRARRRYE
jgi:hypothetical protein